MCICAAEIQMCTYACRVRASLALDTGERTRRPCYNVFTSLAKNASAKSFDVCQLDEIEHRYERKWPQRLLCARANLKHYFLTWPSPVRSCLAHAASCWLRSPCNTILNTNLQERLVMSNDSPSGRQLENGTLTSKPAHTSSRRTIGSPDAEEYAPTLHSMQLTSLIDPEIKKALCRVCTGAHLVLVIGEKLFGSHGLTSMKTLFSKQS